MEKAGEIEFSEPLLKRLMKENNPDRDDKFIDENYPAAIRQLKWQEIKNQLAVEAARRTTREQFAQYGMNLPEDVVEKYAEETLKKGDQIERLIDDVIDNKLIDSYKGIMTLEHKSVTLDEFNKLLDKK